MAANLYTLQGKNKTKTWLLMSFFLVLVIAIGYFASYYFQSPYILYFFIIFSVMTNIFSYWFSDKMVLKIAHAKEAKKEEYYDLYTTVENLSITAGLPMPKVYVINDASPNAFATGRDKDHAAVAFTTGLLNILEKPELEGVVAHELAHIGNRDILLQTVVVVLVGMIAMIADFFLRITIYGGGRNNDNKGGGPLMIIALIFVILSPIFASILQLAISRKREFLADATGAMITRYPEGLASALLKIENSAHEMKHVNHATAHMYISDPYINLKDEEGHKKKPGFMTKLFRTHPLTSDRVKELRGNV